MADATPSERPLEMRKSVVQALLQLEKWLSDNGFAGYDPYDIRGQDWFIGLFGGQSWFKRKLRSALTLVEQRLPEYRLRKLLRIGKEVNAKGMGLFCRAFLVQFGTTGEEHYLSQAEGILEWLKANPSQGYPGVSWGYPFHWQSRLFFPRGTPSAVVTGTVGDAWLDHFELTGSRESLEIAHEIGRFFLEGLHRFERENGQICFSYTPLDHYTVLNASLFVASFLARLGRLDNCPRYIDLAERAALFVVSEQNVDGSFYYWAMEPPSTIDHFHTGFVLRHLDIVQQECGNKIVRESVKRGYVFYLSQLFAPNGLPRLTPDSLFPIDVHSISEAILCLCQFGERYGGLDRLVPLVDFVFKEMRSEKGFFFAEIQRQWWGERKVKIPFIRWGQAWMMFALARLSSFLASTSSVPARGIS